MQVLFGDANFQIIHFTEASKKVLHFLKPAAIKFEFLTLKSFRESNMSFGDAIYWLLGKDSVNSPFI